MGQVYRLQMFTYRSQLIDECAKLCGQRISGQIHLDNYTFLERFQRTFGSRQFLGSKGVSVRSIRHDCYTPQ